MRRVFLESFNVIPDVAGTFAKGTDRYADQIVADVNRIEKALKSIGLSKGSARDAVEIIDMPNDDAALATLLGSLSVNEIRTVTLRAFHEDLVKKTLQQMS